MYNRTIVKNSILYILFSLIFILTISAYSQENAVPPDSTRADSVQIAPPETKKSDIDTTIYYDAADIFTDVDNRTTELIGKAEIKYKNITLKAEKITLDWNNYLMIAEPLPDTVWVKKDSASTDSTMKIEFKGVPVLVEGNAPMSGDTMIYNYKTEKGRVVRGRTEMEGGFYTGQQIKRVKPDIFHIKNSSFTTCDLDSNPHFHFRAKKLKMIMNDKVIAKPIIMYMGHIPMAALPFAVFPNKTGRQSGIIIPRYGESAQEGRFLREMGYYWAPNDYFDSRLMVDFFEKSGWLFRGGANYNVRYMLNGRLSGSYTKKTFGTNKTQRWDMRVNHSQTIDPTSRLSVSGYFVSDKNFYKNFSTNLNTRLTRELRSNATYSKSWPKQKLSMSMNLSRVHDLQDDVTQQTLPQVSFRMGQTQIFKPKKTKSRPKPGERRRRSGPKWYESLYFSYNSNLLSKKREYLIRTSADTTKEVEKTRRLTHNVAFSLTSPKKYFGWLSLNQNLSATEDWFDETQNYFYDQETEKIESEKVKGFAARHTFNYNASANTKLYGMFAPGIGDIQAIRHVVTPSVSFRYQPDFSDPQWGYYREIVTPDGTSEKKDRFGGTSRSGSKNLSLSVRNLFQMKKGVGEKEKKIDLFTMDFSTGFNFEAEKNKLSDLRTSWQANPARNFSLSASTTHSFYRWDETAGTSYSGGIRTNQYLFENGGWKKGELLQMTSLRLNISLRLQGKGDKDSRKRDNNNRNTDLIDREPDPLLEEENLSVLEEDLLRRGNRFEDESSFSTLSIPWRTSLNFSFNLDKRNPNKPQKRYYLDIRGAEMNLTRKWRIGYSAHIDLEKKQVAYHSMTFFRDLHCWEANIDWVPSGPSKRIYVRVNIKAQVLQDIKLEKRGGAQSVLGY